MGPQIRHLQRQGQTSSSRSNRKKRCKRVYQVWGARIMVKVNVKCRINVFVLYVLT
jgi:hypothetical protein